MFLERSEHSAFPRVRFHVTAADPAICHGEMSDHRQEDVVDKECRGANSLQSCRDRHDRSDLILAAEARSSLDAGSFLSSP
jgi:hypothetical protein